MLITECERGCEAFKKLKKTLKEIREVALKTRLSFDQMKIIELLESTEINWNEKEI